jgi:hypothetical protein
MKIYSRTDATQIAADPDPILPDDEGAFEVPEELGNQLIDFHGPDGKLFESGAQRNDRKAVEDLERRKSPEALFELMKELVESSKAPAAPEIKETAAQKKAREKAEAEDAKVAEDAALAEIAETARVKAAADEAEAAKAAKSAKAPAAQ